MALKETPFQDAAATGQFHFLTGLDANGDVQSETSWGGSFDVLRTTVPSATFTNTLFRSTVRSDRVSPSPKKGKKKNSQVSLPNV